MGKTSVPALISIILLAGMCYFLHLFYTRQIDQIKRDAVDQFHFNFYHNDSTWIKNTWLGVKAQQNPNDVWITQEIISEVRPDLIIEAGSMFGGGAIIWAHILDQVNPAGRVITIDIEDRLDEARKVPIFQEKVEFIYGSSTAPETIERLKSAAQGKRVLVILDSDHSKNHVDKELELYAPLVSVGSYLIVQDSNVNGHPVFLEHGPGPYESIHDFMVNNAHFEIDKSRERLLFTMHPNGYLKRVK